MQRRSSPHHRRSAHRSDRLQRHVWAHHHGRPLWLRNSQRRNGCRGASTRSLPRRHARGSNSSHRPPRGRPPFQRGPGPCRRPASAASTILSPAAHRQSGSLSAHSRSTARWFPATATASAYTGRPSCRRTDAIPLPQLQRQGALGERQRLPPGRRSDQSRSPGRHASISTVGPAATQRLRHVQIKCYTLNILISSFSLQTPVLNRSISSTIMHVLANKEQYSQSQKSVESEANPARTFLRRHRRTCNHTFSWFRFIPRIGIRIRKQNPDPNKKQIRK